MKELLPLFSYLFENKFSQIGSPIRNEVSKLQEKFKETNDSNVLLGAIFKFVALNHQKLFLLLNEFESKAFSYENYGKLQGFLHSLIASLESQKNHLKKDGLLLVNSFLCLGQLNAMEFEIVKNKSEGIKAMNGKILC